MNTFSLRTTVRRSPTGQRAGTLFVLLFLALRVFGFPPAPHHLFYGMVRDEYGTPIDTPGSQIILVSASGLQLKTMVNPGVQPGVNYKLEIPMDAGLTSDLYKPTAMQPTLPFQIVVVINGRTNRPIELKGNFAQMGKPGRETLLNLTLGEDTDGDGLPDAWERLINPDISKVNPGDSRGNGLTALQEYLAGIYPADDAEGFQLTISGLHDGEPRMSFLAIQGRSYSMVGSTDLTHWSPVTFRIPAVDVTVRSNYQATEVQVVEVQAVTTGLTPVPTFFKLLVQ